MKNEANIICTTCPTGCRLRVIFDDKVKKKVEGNQCRKGLQYAESELNDPRRMLTTTVKVRGGIHPLVPVQTRKPVPKALIFPILKEIRHLELKAPVRMGQVVIKNISGTGIDIIASRDLPADNSRRTFK